ncbi:MAG: Ig-like domain-containing protein [Trueperaceae bacterium]
MRYLRFATFVLVALTVSLLLAACGEQGDGVPQPGSTEGTYELTTIAEGPGSVVIEELDFNCSDECTARVGAGVSVELLAQADSGKGFVGWEQGCTGNGQCTIEVDGDKTVRAVFAENVLALQMNGDGDGSVRIVPPDVTCNDDCTHGFPTPVNVSLTVTLAEGSVVKEWGGACSDSATRRYCQLPVEGQTSATLTLVRPPVANPDSDYSVEEGQRLDVNAANGVLSNDSDGGGESLTAQLVTQPSKGDLNLRSDGSFTYTPDSGATGGDSFSYRARDSSGNLSQAVGVSIAITELESFLLSVDVTGLGNGTVTSNPSGINCGTDCNEAFKDGTSVTLTASEGPGSRFTGWGDGACSGSSPTCVVNMNSDKVVRANFELTTFPLSYSREGEGQGTITLSPMGAGCGDGCQSYTYDQNVVLTAVEAEGSDFAGWSGDCSGNEPVCDVDMTEARSVVARFETEPPVVEHELTVAVTEGTDGSVTNPGTIDCPGDCKHNFTQGETITLTANDGPDWNFTEWGGDCSEATGKTCQVTMSQARNVSAEFQMTAPPVVEHELTVAVTEGTDGSVTNPGTIDCPGDCKHNFTQGETITLTANDGPDWNFTEWGGDCSEATGPVCELEMLDDRSATAMFAPEQPPPQTLEVDIEGSGQGSVASTPDGIDCPGVCEFDFDEGTEVELNATAGADSLFSDWNGCDDPQGSTCTVVMNGPKTVEAVFTQVVTQPTEHTLTTRVSGDGDGSVTSSPGTIDCPAECEDDFEEGEQVTLTAVPADTSELDSWTGCDETADLECIVTISTDRTVSATFTPLPQENEATVLLNGDGDGTVTSAPDGIDCTSASEPEGCSATFAETTTVSLEATASEGSNFSGWNGDCTGTGSCSFSMSEPREVTATFDLATATIFQLTISPQPSLGTVTSEDEGIDCGPDANDCSEEYEEGSPVQLTARPAPDASFVDWTNACSGEDSTCSLTIDQNQTLTATFDEQVAEPEEVELHLAFIGEGLGSVEFDAGADSCSNTCDRTFAFESTISLTARAEDGSDFSGWSEECSEPTNEVCQLTMEDDKSISVSFDPTEPTDSGGAGDA